MAKTIKRPASADDVDQYVAKRIRSLRGHLGFSQGDLGEAVGIAYQQIHKYERCEIRISAGKLYQIAKALKVPVQSFFPGDQMGEYAPLTTKRMRIMRIVGELADKHDDDMLRIVRALERMVLGTNSVD